MMTTSGADSTYLAGTTVSPEQIQDWVETFHQQALPYLSKMYCRLTGALSYAPIWIGH